MTSPEQNESRKYSAPAAACAADMLFLLARSEEALSVAEIARELAQSKSLVYRVARVLEERGVLKRVETNRFWLGIGALEIGGAFATKADFTATTRETLRELARTLDTTVTLAVLRGADVFYVMSQEAPHALVHVGFVGNRVPANCTALGKALLADLAPEDVRARFAYGLPALTPLSITSGDVLDAELARVRDQGYATANGETIVGRMAIAIPVQVPGLGEPAALSVASNTPSFLDEPQRLLDALKEARERLVRLNEVRDTLQQSQMTFGSGAARFAGQ